MKTRYRFGVLLCLWERSRRINHYFGLLISLYGRSRKIEHSFGLLICLYIDSRRQPACTETTVAVKHTGLMEDSLKLNSVVAVYNGEQRG